MWKTFDFQQTKITTHMAKGKCAIGHGAQCQRNESD